MQKRTFLRGRGSAEVLKAGARRMPRGARAIEDVVGGLSAARHAVRAALTSAHTTGDGDCSSRTPSTTLFRRRTTRTGAAGAGEAGPRNPAADGELAGAEPRDEDETGGRVLEGPSRTMGTKLSGSRAGGRGRRRAPTTREPRRGGGAANGGGATGAASDLDPVGIRPRPRKAGRKPGGMVAGGGGGWLGWLRWLAGGLGHAGGRGGEPRGRSPHASRERGLTGCIAFFTRLICHFSAKFLSLRVPHNHKRPQPRTCSLKAAAGQPIPYRLVF